MSPIQFLASLKPLSGRSLRLAVALGVLAGWLIILQAWLLARVVDAVVFQHATLMDVQAWLGAMLAVFIARALLTRWSERIAFSAAAAIKKQLRDMLYQRLLALGPLASRDERSGALVNMLADGVDAIEGYFARYLPATSLMVMVPLSVLFFVMPLDWTSGLILLLTAPLIPFFMILIGKGAEKLNQKQWRKMARMSAHFLDVIQGLTTLKLFSASRREAETVGEMSELYRRDTMAVLRVAFLSSLTLEFLATVSIALVAVTVGFRLFWGNLEFLRGFFVLLLAPEFYLPLRNMGTHYHARMEAIAAVDEMNRLLDIPLPEAGALTVSCSGSDGIGLEINAVSLRYGEDRPALENCSFSIAAGETVALVGPSGGGKSTLMNLLLGFVSAQSGEVKVNGQVLATLEKETWWQHVAWVPQKPHLFAGSLMDNIRLGNVNASRADVEQAARDAGAHDFIVSLPAGYDFELGEQGQGLSGGEAQRIAIARAFLKDAPLVLLDEATAHLDAVTESVISDAMQRLARGRTVVMIAHRLKTVTHADRIVVLAKGAVAEQGRFEELAATGGLFAKLLQQGLEVRR